MTVYTRLRDLREDHDKTQTEIAEYLGTTAQYYGRYELGQAQLPLDRAVMLAKYYNVSLDYIAGLTDNKVSPSDMSAASRLNNFVSSLTARDKLMLTRLAGYIAEM